MPGDYELEPAETEDMALSDLLSRVLDRGLVVSGQVIISVADIDLVELDLRIVMSAVERRMQSLVEEEP